VMRIRTRLAITSHHIKWQWHIAIAIAIAAHTHTHTHTRYQSGAISECRSERDWWARGERNDGPNIHLSRPLAGFMLLQFAVGAIIPWQAWSTANGNSGGASAEPCVLRGDRVLPTSYRRQNKTRKVYHRGLAAQDAMSCHAVPSPKHFR
jgi:hypothetical protein